MKLAAVALASCVVAGCSSYLPDERVVGHFMATTGEAINIRSDGRIFFAHGANEEFVGMVTVTRDTPLTIFVVAPDTSPLVGTVIKFSADRQVLAVEWQDALHRHRPARFQKQ